MISKDKIKELQAKLQTEYESHVSNANAAKGAIQICTHLLELPDETILPCAVEGCPTKE